MLEEVVGREAAVEFLLGEEPVVAAVLLARPARAGRRRDRELELRHSLHEEPCECALSLPRGAGNDEDRLLRRLSG